MDIISRKNRQALDLFRIYVIIYLKEVLNAEQTEKDEAQAGY